MKEKNEMRIPVGYLKTEVFGPFENRDEAVKLAETAILDPLVLAVSGFAAKSGNDFIFVLSADSDGLIDVGDLVRVTGRKIQDVLEYNS